MKNIFVMIRTASLPSPLVYSTMAVVADRHQEHPEGDLPHRHDYYAIIAVEQASGWHHLDFQAYPLTPHTLYFVAPEQVHHLTLTAPDPQGWVLCFKPDFLWQQFSPQRLAELELFFNCDESLPLTLDRAEWEGLSPFFAHLGQVTTASTLADWEALGAWLKLLLLACYRLRQSQRVTATPWHHRPASIVRQFKSDVEQHFKNWHQVSAYASAQNLSSNYLNEVIKAETGQSAKEFIQQRVLLEAKRLARFTDWSVKEIAYSLGYEDVAHFSKFFKKQAGLSLSAFKEAEAATAQP